MIYQYKNILFEYHEFEEYISIIDVQIARPSMNRVFEIPEKINNKPVTSLSNYGMYNVSLYIKDCKDIIIPSTINKMCNLKCSAPLNIHVDSLDHYFKISNHLCFGRHSKLYINKILITTLKLNPNIPCHINGLEINTIDCTDLINFTGIQFFECDINRIINTNNIEIIPSNFSTYTYWNEPLYFPKVVIIDSKSFALDAKSITLNCPNLIFVESNIILSKLNPFIIPTIHIQTNTNPIIYSQEYRINVNDCYTSGNY